VIICKSTSFFLLGGKFTLLFFVSVLYLILLLIRFFADYGRYFFSRSSQYICHLLTMYTIPTTRPIATALDLLSLESLDPTS